MFKKIIKLSFFAFLLHIGFINNVKADTPVGGSITSNTIWTKNSSPFVVTSDINIYPEATLTIEAGVTIKLNAGTAVIIGGGLSAIGTSDEKIVFTSNTESPGKGDWKYLKFIDSSTDAVIDGGSYVSGNIVQYCVIEYAENGIFCENASPFISDNIIQYNQKGIFANGSSSLIYNNSVATNIIGISAQNASITIDGNSITNNISSTYGEGAGAGIFVYDYYPTSESFINIVNNTISNNETLNYPWGGGVYYFSEYSEYPTSLTIENNIISGNKLTSRWDCVSASGISYNFHSSIPTSLTIKNNEIKNNISSGSSSCVNAFGGGIYFSYFPTSSNGANLSIFSIENNDIEGNTATDENNLGGQGGGIHIRLNYYTPYIQDARPTFDIKNNRIKNNTARLGGGIYYTMVDTASTVDQSAGINLKFNFISDNYSVTGGVGGIYLDLNKGMGTISRNNIQNNQYYDLYNNSDHDILMPDNWWGSTDTSIIDGKIHDYYDDIQKGKVIYQPIAEEQIKSSEDIIPPNVGAVSPLNGATSVPIDVTISAIFSEDIDAVTINTDTFSVDNGISGTVSYDANSKTATFTTGANFNPGTTYTATITTGVKDLAGNPLQTDYAWSFATATVGATVSGTVEFDDYTGGDIFLKLYDGQDPDQSKLLAETVLSAPGPFSLGPLADMGEINIWLYAVWDQNQSGSIDFGDKYGATSFHLSDDTFTVPSLPLNNFDNTIDFSVTGGVKNVHMPDGSYSTLLEVEISNFIFGSIPDDIDNVIFEGPSGVLATLAHPDMEFEKEENCGWYSVSLPDQPELGTYTFSVNSGGTVRTSTDTQTVIREQPLPDESSFSPGPDAVVSSMTPIFSWNPISYSDVPLYYRLEIRDAAGNIEKTSRTLDMTSFVVPQGILLPGQSFAWRVRISDSDDWISVENRSQSDWQSLTMAATLGHPAKPVVDLDTTGVQTITTSDGTDLDLWVKVIDHDGVTGASHTVIATPPVGDPVTLNFNYSDGAKTGFFDAAIDPAVTGIPLNSYAGDWTFTVTDPAGNDASTVDTLNLAPLPIPDVTSFSPVNGTTVANTTPTFSWAALTGINAGNVKRYRVRIFTSDGASMVWSRYLGTETSCTVPPGVLKPGTTYSYRIDAYDAHVGFDIDNRSYTPTLSEGYLTFTTGLESPDPYIDLDNTGVYTWNSSKIFGPSLSFWVRVFDPQGVPGNIASVKAILPSGKQVPLRYEYNEGATSAYYASDTLEPLTSGAYTLQVEDLEGNTYETTEALDSATIGYPAEDSLTPTHSTLIGSTAVDFDWADVPGAAFYWVEIYDASFDKIWRFATIDSQFNLPAGYLAEGTYYAYRISTRREFIGENTDNMSAVPFRRSSRFNFITTATLGSADPGIATNNYGAMLWHNPWPDDPATSYYWMAFSVRVTDADGPPNGIREVKVTAPSGTTFPDGTTTRTLSYYGNVAVDEAEYRYVEDIANPTDMPEGTYAFSVTDVNGNTAVTTDYFTRNLLDLPTNLLPPPDSDVFGTTPTISWDPVDGAASYRIDLYNEPGDRIYFSDLSESFFTVPEGLLEIGKTYTYRVRAHRTDPRVADLDNVSSSETSFDHLRPHFTVRAIVDSDNDGIPDTIENAVGCLDANDADTDDDGIPDGVEDKNRNGNVDRGETDPCDPDTDADGIQDGTESGYTLDDVGPDTDLAFFFPDLDPSTTTNPLLADTDGDGIIDGDEDRNKNGRVDADEGNPNIHAAVAKSKAMPWIPLLLLND